MCFFDGRKMRKDHFFGSEDLKSLSNHYTGGGTSIPCSVSKLVMMLEWWVIDFFRNQESGPCTNTRKSSQPNWERKKYWTSKIVFVCFFVYFFVFRGPWNSCCNLSSRSINFSPSKLYQCLIRIDDSEPQVQFWWKKTWHAPKRRSTRMSQEVSKRLVNGF